MIQAAYRALQVADTEAALSTFAETVAQAPADYEARYGLAAALMQAGESAHDALNNARVLQALAIMRGAGVDVARLRTDPTYAGQIGVQLYNQNHVACASVAWSLAMGVGEIDGGSLLNFALALQHQGRTEEASQYLRVAVENFPSAHLHNFLVYSELFCEDGERRHAEEARAWGRRWAAVPPPAPHANPTRAGRKLRIGYVAPRFAEAQLRQFITPVLEAHDPERVEVVLYPAEASTETGWPAWIKVRPIRHLNDAAAAELIRSDRIDVLNDCWGHTSGSRLGVFARKPAPVQVAWINSFHTTGLPQMDYVLHGGQATLDHADQFTEQLWPIGPTYSPFRPARGRLDPVETPAKAAGVVTLGSFNHPAKLSDGALAAWATVLRNAPSTQLLLKYNFYADPVLQNVTRARFAAHGVLGERLLFATHTSGEEYFRSFQTVDLMLDSWPHTGSTTTLEALSNGVPVLTMADERSIGGRYAATLLRQSGLPELVTDSPEAFVARALELAADTAALNALRSRVRPAFEGGAFCDEAGFVRRLEAAFCEMFDLWRAGQATPLALAR